MLEDLWIRVVPLRCPGALISWNYRDKHLGHPQAAVLESLPHPSPPSRHFLMGGAGFPGQIPAPKFSTFTPSRLQFLPQILPPSPGGEGIPPGHGLDQVFVPQNTLGSDPALVPQEPGGSRCFQEGQDPGKGIVSTREQRWELPASSDRDSEEFPALEGLGEHRKPSAMDFFSLSLPAPRPSTCRDSFPRDETPLI